MKILYHHRIAARDGMDVHKTELIKAFRQLGHEVIEVGPMQQQKAEFGAGGGWVDTVRRHLPKLATETLEIIYDHFAYRRLKKAYLAHRPDVLYERHNLFLSAGMRLKKKYAIPFLLEVNAPLAEERSKNGGLALARFAHRQEGAVWRSADRIFPVTHVLAKYLLAKKVQEDRIAVIPNAVDPEVFNPDIDGTSIRQKYGLEDAMVLGFTGFIRDWHGLDQIIDALPDLIKERNVHFLIVGDGPACQALRTQATKRGVTDHVHFTGIVSREEIPQYIAAFDIALQPAVTPYASPLKLFEYLAMGKMVLAPDEENIREVIEDGVNGFLFSKNNEFALGILQKACADHSDYKISRSSPANNRSWQDNAKVTLSRFQ
jgi:glycosyltransferase involved in cell wall biosynthesis